MLWSFAIPIGGLNDAQIRIHHNHDTVKPVDPLLIGVPHSALFLTPEEVMNCPVSVVLTTMPYDKRHLITSDTPLITTLLGVMRDVLLQKGIAVRGWPPSKKIPVAYSFSYPCDAELMPIL